MQQIKWAVAAVLALAAGHQTLISSSSAQTQALATAPAATSKNVVAWASKPAKLPPYTGPNRLVYRGRCPEGARGQGELDPDRVRQPRLHR